MGLHPGFSGSGLPTSLTRSPDGWNVTCRFAGHVAAKNPAHFAQQSPTSALRDECRTNRGLQIAEASPDVDRCDGRAEAHPYRVEKNGSGP
jgi:hypothetical protein